MTFFLRASIFLVFFVVSLSMKAQINLGSGSYSQSFPGVDIAGRNSFPSGTPYLSGNAQGKPVPTNDWWSKLVKEGQADNLFNYPFTLKTQNDGLIVSYIPWGVIGDSAPIKIGLTGLSSQHTTISDYSDWTVSMNWASADKRMTVTSGVGMPFLYFEKSLADEVTIEVNSGTVSIQNEQLIIQDASYGVDFVVFAPSGSIWNTNGNIFTSSLNGKTYWSLAMLPQEATDVDQAVAALKDFAFVFPTDTKVSWSYDQNQATLRSIYTVSTVIKEGSQNLFYQGLLPHQWAHLSPDSPSPSSTSYTTVRGEMKMLIGNSFSLENKFSGILPTLPNVAHYSDSFDIAALASKIQELENASLDLWTDSYNEGQLMNRLVQTARIAHETGQFEARDKMIKTVKDRLENWLSYTSGETAFLFYYQPQWTALLGYPAGHGQDSNINDHHFHWGYFIHAAAFIEQFDPGWVSQWGPMIELLIRDAASENRNDPLFPFLRNFSPYAGHSWANGFASFPQGNDQESTSESMQFNSSLIHYGSITGNDAIRDLGIFLYTTEKTAIEEYWFDSNDRNFPVSQPYGLVSRVWGNSFDNGTFWTSDITASYGIEMYPIHGGSYYLAANPNYTQKIWSEMEQFTDILNPESTNPNLWYDTFWKYLALVDPGKALQLYEQSPNRNLKFGISDAQTYYWLHSSNALGVPRPDISADFPIAMAFEKDGLITYIAHNYSNQSKSITFSNGYTLIAAANKMTSSRDLDVSGQLRTAFDRAYANSPIQLELVTQSAAITKVEFYSGTNLVFTDTEAPYTFTTAPLSLGVKTFYTRLYVGNAYQLSNQIAVTVGEQLPFQGIAHSIPGTIEAGNFDEFEGGNGQQIAYFDSSKGNIGDYRTEEEVDVVMDTNEGPTVGWIDSGEWLEYSISVVESGYYTLSFRYASGSNLGGGPFRILVDDRVVASNVLVSQTSNTDWNTYATKSVTDIPFTSGDHVLRLQFDTGGFNLGKLQFSLDRALDYLVPSANAGENRSLILPNSETTLDASASTYSGSAALTYNWKQVYGPSVVNFGTPDAAISTVSNLVKGVYKFELQVNADAESDRDEVIISVNETGNHPPAIRISAPESNVNVRQGSSIVIKARASDLDGTVDKVSFYQNGSLVGEDFELPFEYNWSAASIGSSEITAIATDNLGLNTTSEPINITVDAVKQCVESGTGAQQGQFSVGYKSTFETIGTSVTITFELLDSDKSGVVAYLWQANPFQEFQLEQIAPNQFSKTINGLSLGQQISFACKFAFAGGLSVTPYISYTVGSDCSEVQDNTSPTNFEASLVSAGATSVTFEVYAEDNSGAVIYSVVQNGIEQLFSAESAQVSQITYSGLLSDTAYEFILNVKDGNGNLADGQKTILVTTAPSNNTSCSGESNIAQQGSFELGYSYSFKTEGSQVIIEFELLDDKPDLVAYLWKENPFTETPMTPAGPRKFKSTLPNQILGQQISYAVKFAFAGGLAVTKYFQYSVGDTCEVTDDQDQDGVLDALDQCPDTPIGVMVNVFGCEVFSLPTDTFLIRATSATCPDSANGTISISSNNTEFDFMFSINGEADQPLVNNSHIISDLAAGTYTICITVDGVSGYERCFTIGIEAPDPLQATSSIDIGSKGLSLTLSGASQYNVTYNGKSFITTGNTLSLTLEPGLNRIQVSTELDCQGLYFKEIFVSEEVRLYPNPTFGPLQLLVAGNDQEVQLSIASISGQVVEVERIQVPNSRIIETSLARLATGMYLITLEGKTVKTVHVVIKK